MNFLFLVGLASLGLGVGFLQAWWEKAEKDKSFPLMPILFLMLAAIIFFYCYFTWPVNSR